MKVASVIGMAEGFPRHEEIVSLQNSKTRQKTFKTVVFDFCGRKRYHFFVLTDMFGKIMPALHQG